MGDVNVVVCACYNSQQGARGLVVKTPFRSNTNQEKEQNAKRHRPAKQTPKVLSSRVSVAEDLGHMTQKDGQQQV